ncbi:MAG: uracil-DNA glycosylase [Firmicutes bacterium]|nr:uracil-DNA glycosylase [Bacillota bacterium]
MNNPQLLSTEWKEELRDVLDTPFMRDLAKRVYAEYDRHTVFPKKENLFAALNLCPPDRVSVVILGQDPYHTPGAANGLAFSRGPEFKSMPPSLGNIIKEVENCFGKCNVRDGDLTPWAKQGVLLLNTCLTVRAHTALSHKDMGWEVFTRAVVERISKRGGVVFVLWGSHARKFKDVITRNGNLILETVHPSPLSAHNGFFGCGHFTKINEFLEANDKAPIDF